jgi:NADH dehydrogenase
VLLDRQNYFVFTPLLVEAGTGSLEPRHAVVSIRAFLPDAKFKMAEISGIDVEGQEVHYHLPEIAQTESIEYDYLVLALGSVTNLPPVSGLAEFGFEMKSLADAVALRDRAIRMLELADCTPDAETRRALLHFVFVGGNFTGAEAAGEFEAFLREATRQYSDLRPSDVSVTLIEVTDRLLRALDPDLSEYATEKMRRRGIQVLLNESVEKIAEESVQLRSGRSIDARTVIWCAGIAPCPQLEALPLPKDERGYLLTEHDLRVPGHENIWALGDCAVNPGPSGSPYPATAQHAIRQGKHAAADIARVLHGQPTRHCNIETSGSLAAVGCRTGVARVFGFKLSGFLAWWMWRTVYFLKMPGLKRKIRVALDWTFGLFFPRDHVQLGVIRGARSARFTRGTLG